MIGFVTYFIAFLFEMILLMFNSLIHVKLEYSPKALIAYSMSSMIFHRLRADTALNYNPLFKPDEALRKSAKWYDAWYLRYKELKKFIYVEKKAAKRLDIE